MKKTVVKTSPNENVFLPFEKKWVALTQDNSRIIAHAKTIKELTKKLDLSKSKDSVITYVNSFVGSYSPQCS